MDREELYPTMVSHIVYGVPLPAHVQAVVAGDATATAATANARQAVTAGGLDLAALLKLIDSVIQIVLPLLGRPTGATTRSNPQPSTPARGSNTLPAGGNPT